MRFVLPALAALSVAAISSPAFAQQKVVNTNYGFSYIVPSGYRIDDPARYTPSGAGDVILQFENPIFLTINEGTVTRTLKDNRNLQLLSNIDLFLFDSKIMSALVGNQNMKDMTEQTARSVVQNFNRLLNAAGANLDYQRNAKIKVGGEDALAILCNISDKEIDEYGTARLIFMPRPDGKTYMFSFAALNSEYETKVKAFDKFMASFKFMKAPGTEKPAPKPKPAPTPKPKRKK